MSRRQFTSRLAAFAIVLATLGSGPFAAAEIRHLELGAANGPLQRNLSDSLRERRYRVLIDSVRGLIAVYGAEGVIYLNDIEVEALEEAAAHLRAWLDANGGERVRVETRPGNYAVLSDLPHVTTANLNNPGYVQLPHYGNFRSLLANEEHPRIETGTQAEFNRLTTEDLERLAALSDTGLRITTYYQDVMETLPWLLQRSRLETIAPIGPEYRRANGDRMPPLRGAPPRPTSVYRLRSNASLACPAFR